MTARNVVVRWVRGCLLVALIAVAAVSAVRLMTLRADSAAAVREYAALPAPKPRETAAPPPVAVRGDDTPPPAPPLDLSDINPDYVGWVSIADTPIDYPVARGADNLRYLSTTFSGAANPAGSIFMDTRCVDGFDGDLAILYGHNMKDGTMFAPLHRLLDGSYLETHGTIAVITRDGGEVRYQIAAVFLTDVTDGVYALPGGGRAEADAYLEALGIPAGAQALVLSTCANTGVKTDRLLVVAYMFSCS